MEAQAGQEQFLAVLEQQRSVVLAAAMGPWVRGLEESLQRVQVEEGFLADPFQEWVSWSDSVGWVGYRVPRAKVLPVEEEARANARDAAWDRVYGAIQERAWAVDRVPRFRGREILSLEALLRLRDDGVGTIRVLEWGKGWEFHCVTQQTWEEMALWQRVLWADQRWAWEQLASAESQLSQLWALLDQRELWSVPGGPLMPGTVLEGRWEARRGADAPGYVLGDQVELAMVDMAILLGERYGIFEVGDDSIGKLVRTALPGVYEGMWEQADLEAAAMTFRGGPVAAEYSWQHAAHALWVAKWCGEWVEMVELEQRDWGRLWGHLGQLYDLLAGPAEEAAQLQQLYQLPGQTVGELPLAARELCRVVTVALALPVSLLRTGACGGPPGAREAVSAAVLQWVLQRREEYVAACSTRANWYLRGILQQDAVRDAVRQDFVLELQEIVQGSSAVAEQEVAMEEWGRQVGSSSSPRARAKARRRQRQGM
jgi:hypothetical protein